MHPLVYCVEDCTTKWYSNIHPFISAKYLAGQRVCRQRKWKKILDRHTAQLIRSMTYDLCHLICNFPWRNGVCMFWHAPWCYNGVEAFTEIDGLVNVQPSNMYNFLKSERLGPRRDRWASKQAKYSRWAYIHKVRLQISDPTKKMVVEMYIVRCTLDPLRVHLIVSETSACLTSTRTSQFQKRIERFWFTTILIIIIANYCH